MAEKKEVKKGPPTSGAWKRYKISGDKIEKLNKSCPKCGPGFLLANHKDRQVCGACGYAEFTKK